MVDLKILFQVVYVKNPPLELARWWIQTFSAVDQMVLPFATMAKWISLELAMSWILGIPIATKARWLIHSFFSIDEATWWI